MNFLNLKKIKKIILSGTSEKYYSEPKTIRKDLITLGIPDSALILDTLGIHTLQSVQFLEKNKIDLIFEKINNKLLINTSIGKKSSSNSDVQNE